MVVAGSADTVLHPSERYYPSFHRLTPAPIHNEALFYLETTSKRNGSKQ
jgi:hypothetical protein